MAEKQEKLTAEFKRSVVYFMKYKGGPESLIDFKENEHLVEQQMPEIYSAWKKVKKAEARLLEALNRFEEQDDPTDPDEDA